ncbi:MAG: spermidine/putrescine ABC transporter substrate-binding protein [Aigarchaeota archaeon]|nr:spermidine/putrescine ABC transporter substrate-binding protein [Aigarchaeota archaeon]MCX8193574.1 spermidine/putrescine ABC transporter substrate-binding protein [Nitrososphaeria archaeon]MDW7986549.1 spermidine/putrescine ABC transporter substrate-binding protein [Nitrososphaerota archaeon]
MVSRRDVLKIAVAGVLGAAVGGAGGYYSRQVEIDNLKKEVEELSKQIGEVKVKLEPNLNIYNWTYYINKNIIEQWAKENGVSIVYDTFESLDEVVAKLQTGTSGYDVAVVSDSPLRELADLGVLEPIDLKKIPNFKYVPERFKNPYFDPENKYSVIYSYGTTGLGWNNKEVSPEVRAWADVFEVDRHLGRYKGKITMHTDTIETFGAALIYLGKDPSSMRDEDLREAVELLKKQKPYLAGYASTEEYMEGLETGRFLISHAYNGDIAGIIYASDEREITVYKQLEYISYAFPEEGALAWADSFVIPKGAKNIESAHAFINFILDPLVSAICTITVKYPFPTGRDYVPEELKEDPVIFTPDEYLDKLYWTRPFTPEERAKRAEYWLELMAA